MMLEQGLLASKFLPLLHKQNQHWKRAKVHLRGCSNTVELKAQKTHMKRVGTIVPLCLPHLRLLRSTDKSPEWIPWSRREKESKVSTSILGHLVSPIWMAGEVNMAEMSGFR